MLDIGWSEMLIILVVALIVIGPKDLPRVARNVGRWIGKARAMAREFQNQLEDLAREAELDKVKEEIDKAGRTDLKRSIEKTIDPKNEIGSAFDPNAESPSAKTKPASSASAKPAPRTTRKPARAQKPVEEQGAEPPAAAAAEAPLPEIERERVPVETN